MLAKRYPEGKKEYIIRFAPGGTKKPVYWLDDEPITSDSTDVIYKLRHMTTWSVKVPTPKHQAVRDACVLSKENEMPYHLKLSFGKWVVLPMPLHRATKPATAEV